MRRRIALLAALLAALAGRSLADDLSGWDERFARAKRTSAGQLASLAEWCDENGMPFNANVVRHRLLRLEPDHEETRKFLGYERKEGAWWRAAAFRDKFRLELTDAERAKHDAFAGRLEAIRRRVAHRLAPLARLAERSAGDDPDHELEWLRRTWAAWEAVLVVRPEDEKAHQGLHHPTYQGRYVPSGAVPFLEARDRRAKRAAAIAKKHYELGPSTGSRLMIAADVRGYRRRTPNVAVATTFGDEAAVDMVLWAERAIEALVTENGFPASAVEHHKIRRVYVVAERDQIHALLGASGWSADRIEKQLGRFRNAYVDGGVISWRESAADGIDATMHYVARSVVRAATLESRAALEGQGPDVKLEPWLRESLATEVVRRLTGEARTKFSEIPEYAHGGRDTTGRDQWMALARFRVETDDDVPLRRLAAKELNDLDGAATVKGYAFLRYLQERDAAQARRFVWVALSKGSPRAAEAVWGETLEELDAGYRKWVLMTW